MCKMLGVAAKITLKKNKTEIMDEIEGDENGEVVMLLGVLNPEPEPNGKITSYPTAERMQRIVDRINNESLPRLPLIINHVTETVDKKPIIPAGAVLQAAVKEGTNQCHIMVGLYNTKMGKIAQNMVSDPENPISEFSLGYHVDYTPKDQDGLQFPTDIHPVEVSLCYKGDRPGTVIRAVTTLDEVKKMGKKNTEVKQKAKLPISTPSGPQVPVRFKSLDSILEHYFS